MKKYINYLFFFTFFIVFTACSSKSSQEYNSSTYINTDKKFPNKQVIRYKIIDDNSKEVRYNDLHEKLNLHYKSWKGVKYKYGGNSKKGIDCSAFVQKTFRDNLNIKIPRTTALQSKVGIEVNKSELEMGDLIFFKTGYNSRHVGIYLEGGKFMHASTKRGVTISRLDNTYYRKHFWKIKRVLD